MLRAKYFSTALSFTAIFDSGCRCYRCYRRYRRYRGYRRYRHYRRYRLYRGCGVLGLWAFLGEDLGVEVRGEDGCYCFFEGGYF